ncbi:tRNA CCA-pyrophosphorylase [Geobacillus subterraneus]|uniref:CCA-adding enzyme n=2 Tax=Geobacillus TaxID=129337 RepID=A0ABN4NJU6_9BACL|nr:MULTISPECIES: CCA tRNA nucleotidyltransferase [Geobacillus]AMX83121.1 tRNA CCA-pyrophosphorylase [Geobacillus subterraneus]KZS24355.1 CCA tRNA nucleotidyltransferase [Geobacillus subterraneus]OXB91216.1 CCA tRNA nucleotidyltransferase [Geobacillus uzenensis]QIZ68144.1 CCA tRNA nucleotidyltransferase [Geobacillus subterraneus]WPZ17159.1 CCA tRNA nucleotidyltransferase [Geobacillus subterraneus]
MKPPFQQALGIVRQLKRHGHEAYFVGGAVRDLLLGRPIGDVDIATSALPDEVMAIFPKTIDVGSRHGTVVVVHEGTAYEVTTFRTDGDYEDHRRPESVTFVRSLEEDLKRRDFTMNAIAMDEHGTVIDPFGGQEAIEKRLICTVGEADARFREDALRMMRAVRFVSQLGFSLAVATKRAIIANAPLLAHISVERMTMEMEKLLAGPFAAEALPLLAETRLSAYLPGLAEKDGQLRRAAAYRWPWLTSREERWALLCQALGITESRPFLRAWKLPNKVIDEAGAILAALAAVPEPAAWTNEQLFLAGLKRALSVEMVRAALIGKPPEPQHETLRRRFAALPIKTKGELAVNGKEVIEWIGKPAGPWVKETLDAIWRAVVNDEVENEKERIYAWLMERSRTQEKNC